MLNDRLGIRPVRVDQTMQLTAHALTGDTMPLSVHITDEYGAVVFKQERMDQPPTALNETDAQFIATLPANTLKPGGMYTARVTRADGLLVCTTRILTTAPDA